MINPLCFIAVCDVHINNNTVKQLNAYNKAGAAIKGYTRIN